MHFWLIILFVFAHSAFAKPSEDCTGNARFIAPLGDSEQKAFLQRLEKQKKNPKLKEVFEFLQGSAIANPGPLFRVDIDNDGTEEYILTDTEGSGNYLNLVPILVKGNQFTVKRMPAPAGKEGHGPWFVSAYKDQLFTRVCGKTYVSFNEASQGQRPVRMTYLWQGGETNVACDGTWLKYTRDDFKRAYDQKQFETAFGNMQMAYESCKEQMPSTVKFWFLSDLSVTAYRKGDAEACLKITTEARVDPEFSKSDPKVQKAIAQNETLCKNHYPPLEIEKMSFRDLCERLDSPMETNLRSTMFSLIQTVSREGEYGKPDCKKVAPQFLAMRSLILPDVCSDSLRDLRPLLALPQLEDLTLSNGNFLKCSADVSIEDWTPLAKLKIKKLTLIAPDGSLFPESVSRLPTSLETLTLAAPAVSLEGLEKLTRLKTLEIYRGFQKTDIAFFPSVLPALQEMSFSAPDVKGQNRVLDSAFFSWILSQPNLERLYLGYRYAETERPRRVLDWEKTEVFSVTPDQLKQLRSLKKLKVLMINGKDLLKEGSN